MDTNAVFAIAAIWSLVSVAYIVWSFWALSRVFPKLGISGSAAWVPIWNLWQLLQRAGLPGWVAVLVVVPGLNIVTFVACVVAISRLNAEHGAGAGMTVLGALLFPVWALMLAASLEDSEYFVAAFGEYVQPSGSVNRALVGADPRGSAKPGAAPRSSAALTMSDLEGAGAQEVPPAESAAPPFETLDDFEALFASPELPAIEVPPLDLPAPGVEVAPVSVAVSPAEPALDSAVVAAASDTAEPEAPSVLDEWGFSRTTAGAFERLASEDVTPSFDTPLGVSAPRDPFTWPGANPVPAVESTSQSAVANDAAASDAAAAAAAAAVVPADVSNRGASDDRFTGLSDDTVIVSLPDPATESDNGEELLDDTVFVPRAPRWELALPDGSVYRLETSDVTIGRQPVALPGSTPMQIHDTTKTVSKTHARLCFDGAVWTVEDLRSTNGVALVSEDGTVEEIAPETAVLATETMIIGTLEVRLQSLSSGVSDANPQL